MNAIRVFKSLGPIDARNIFRDSTLQWMAFLPLLMALFLRWGVPPLTQTLLEQYGFALAPYYPAILAYFFIVLGPVTLSVLSGFLLLDEKDDNTLTALQVTPLPLNHYIAYRVVVPVLLTIGLMFVVFPVAGLGTLPAAALLLTAVAAAPMSPMFSLFLASIAKNKVQGFALMKLSGMVLLAPVFAFFVGSKWEYAFGIIPTFWPMKVYWMLEAGQEPVWPVFLTALIYQSLVTWFFVKRFNRTMHQ